MSWLVAVDGRLFRSSFTMSRYTASVTAKVPKSRLPRCGMCRNPRWNYPVRVIPCGHSFCQECLKNEIERYVRIGRIRRMCSGTPIIEYNWKTGESHVAIKRFRCPSCTKKIQMMPFVNLLPTNFDLQSLLDAKQQHFVTETENDAEENESNDSVAMHEGNNSTDSDSIRSVDIAMTVWPGPYIVRNIPENYRPRSMPIRIIVGDGSDLSNESDDDATASSNNSPLSSLTESLSDQE